MITVTQATLVPNAAWEADDFADIFRDLPFPYQTAHDLGGHTYEAMFDNVEYCPCVLIFVADGDDETVVRMSTFSTRAARHVFTLDCGGFVWAATLFIPNSNL